MIDFRVLIEQDCETSAREQCELLEISRSSFYYNAKGENPENLEAMRLMDYHIMQEPTAGVITMKLMLKEKEINMKDKQHTDKMMVEREKIKKMTKNKK